MAAVLPLFVGIDVAKATLDIAVRPTAETWSASNDATGLDALVTHPAGLGPDPDRPRGHRGLPGAAGGRAWRPPPSPWSSSIPATSGPLPRRWGSWPKPTALTRGSLRTLRRPSSRRPAPLPDAETQELRALLVRRRQLVEMVSAERARLDTAPAGDPGGHPGPSRLADHRITGLDDALTHASQTHPEWQAKDDRVAEHAGRGPRAGADDAGPGARVGDPGSHKPLAALVGVAPFNRDSGTLRGRRHRVRRPRRGAGGVVYGRAGGHAPQSRDQSLLRAPAAPRAKPRRWP